MDDSVKFTPDTDVESVRRTQLAAERTWLAWWRTGIAATATSIAVGGVLPRLIEGSRGLFVALGAGYGIVAIAIFVAAYRRQMTVLTSIEDDQPVDVAPRVVLGLTIAAVVLSIGTIIAVIITD
jgi:putative membrane protein